MSSYPAPWASLRQHATPNWLRDAKFGTYSHWGSTRPLRVVRTAPGIRTTCTEETPQHKHHVETYGPPSEIEYKDLIPMLRGEEFDAVECADLCRKAGAQFAGPVGEHHDGFAMWDSPLSLWNATRMGPKRDVAGELGAAIRNQGMRLTVALLHAENWWVFPRWIDALDTSEARCAGLYGSLHNSDISPGPGFLDQEKPSGAFLDRWLANTMEMINRYRPDMRWFGFGLRGVREQYRKPMLAACSGRLRCPAIQDSPVPQEVLMREAC